MSMFPQMSRRCVSLCHGVQCTKEIHHEGKHYARTQAGIFVRWTNGEALAYARKLREEEKRQQQEEAQQRLLAEEKRIEEEKKGRVRSHKPFIGWRAWHVTGSDEDPVLMSIARTQIIWGGPTQTVHKKATGELREVHPRNSATANFGQNTESYDHGIYSYKTPAFMMQFLFKEGFNLRYPAVGRVENWGHIVEHEWGYRAQKVVVTGLWLVCSKRDDIYKSLQLSRVAPLEQRYQCDVEVIPEEKVQAWTTYYTKESEDG